MILSLCQNPEALLVSKYVNLILNLIRVLVPIALMISIMVSFIRVITGKADEELPQALKQSVNKILAAVLIFMIPTFISVIMSTMNATSINYKDCLNNATTEKISAAYTARAQKYVEIANESLLRGDYNMAMSQVKKLDDKLQQEQLTAQLQEIEEKITEREEEDLNKMTIGGEFIYPLGDYTTYVTTCFNECDSIHKCVHAAIDLAKNGCMQKPIYASKGGEVTTVVSNVMVNSYNLDGPSCGNYVVLDHLDGTSSKYCHMYPNSVHLKKGDTVSQGEQIGTIGSTGYSTGAHLHFGIFVNGVGVDPLDYVSTEYMLNANRCK